MFPLVEQATGLLRSGSADSPRAICRRPSPVSNVRSIGSNVVTIERHADVLRLVANELARLADAEVGTPADYMSLRVASDLIRTAARHVDAAAAHDADPAMLLTARSFIRGGAAATARIRPETNASGRPTG